MKIKKEFISFLEDSHTFLEKSGRYKATENIIKKSSPATPEFETVRWKNVGDNKPDVAFIERNGQVEIIKFRCSCGCSTAVQLVYDSESENSSLN